MGPSASRARQMLACQDAPARHGTVRSHPARFTHPSHPPPPVYVGNLSWSVSDDSLRQEFIAMGYAVQDSKVRPPPPPFPLPPPLFALRRAPPLTPRPLPRPPLY